MLQTTFLYYLIQISHCQSLSIAAEKLHVSQPALSASIKKLEEQLGVKLLNRTYKGVSLTNEGKNVVELAEKAFDYIQQIETTYTRPNNTEQYTFKDLHIYCNPAYSPVMMSALISSDTSEHDTIQIYDLSPDTDINQLLRDDPRNIVLGIVSDTHSTPKDIISAKLTTSQAYVMCSKNFPYIDPIKTTISFKELLPIPLSILDHSFDFQRILLDSIRKYGSPNIKIISPNSNTVTSAVHNGIAAGFSNKFFEQSSNKNLRYLPIRNAPKFHLSLIAHRDTDKDMLSDLTEVLKQKLL